MTGKPCFHNIRESRKAVSPALSTVIIIAATVVLVLVSSTFALQVLERQQGANEFEAVQKTLLTFDDAFRDVTFDRGGSRSVRFTTNYGYMSLKSNQEDVVIDVSAGTYSASFSPIPVGVLEYSIPTSYVTFGSGYSSYVLGDESSAITSAAMGVGRIRAAQLSDFLTLTLDYRVRVMQEGPARIVRNENGINEWVNYVNILVVRMNITKSMNLQGDFEIVARNLDISNSFLRSDVGTEANSFTVKVTIGDSNPGTLITTTLSRPGRVIFNLIVADVKVGI